MMLRKRRLSTAVEFTNDGKVKGMYALNIKDFLHNHFNICALSILTKRLKYLLINGKATDLFQKSTTSPKSIVTKY